jgi:large conductance mechanosensitive channel
MLREFREFAMRGNVLDMAVGIIIGGAFGKIVSSLVNDVIMPLVGMLLGKVDFSNLFISLSGESYATLADAKAAGAATINYGVFISTVIDFIIIAFAIFVMVKWINQLKAAAETTKKKPEAKPEAPTTKECPYCLSVIPIKATRCGHCTSSLSGK